MLTERQLYPFELVLANGKSGAFDSAEEMAEWYDKNKLVQAKPKSIEDKPPKKRKKVKAAVATSDVQG